MTKWYASLAIFLNWYITCTPLHHHQVHAYAHLHLVYWKKNLNCHSAECALSDPLLVEISEELGNKNLMVLTTEILMKTVSQLVVGNFSSELSSMWLLLIMQLGMSMHLLQHWVFFRWRLVVNFSTYFYFFFLIYNISSVPSSNPLEPEPNTPEPEPGGSGLSSSTPLLWT